MRLALFPLAILTTGGQALGQDCASIGNSSDRLACYDQEAGRTTIAPKSFGGWSVIEANGVNGTAPIASIETTENVQCGSKQGPATLTVDCTGELPLIFFSYECRVGGERDSLLVEFHYPSYSNSFVATPSKDGKSIGTWGNDIQQIRGLSDGGLEVTVSGAATTLTSSKFLLTGTEELQSYLMDRQCIWLPKAG